MNCKWLTLHVNRNNLPAGVVFALRRMPVLETLFLQCQVSHHSKDLNVVEDDWWNSNGIIFDCSVSRLKTVKIAGLAGSDRTYNLVLDFVEFILKNARDLEKVVVTFEDKDMDFVLQVSNKLLNIPKCSPRVVVQVCFR